MMAWDQELSSGLIFFTFMSVQFFQVAHVFDRAPLSVPLHSYCSILPPMADVLSDLSENPDIVDEISRMAEDPSVVAEMQRRGLSLEAVQSVGRFSKLLQMQSTGAEDIAAGKKYRAFEDDNILIVGVKRFRYAEICSFSQRSPRHFFPEQHECDV